MADRPTPPPRPSMSSAPAPKSPRTGARIDPETGRPGIANADVPSETAGLPGVGEGASATHFARDLVEWQNAEGEDESEVRAPADPRDQPRHGSG